MLAAARGAQQATAAAPPRLGSSAGSGTAADKLDRRRHTLGTRRFRFEFVRLRRKQHERRGRRGVMDPVSVPISEILPHGANMVVIDRLVAHDDARSVASVTVRRDSIFAKSPASPPGSASSTWLRPSRPTPDSRRGSAASRRPSGSCSAPAPTSVALQSFPWAPSSRSPLSPVHGGGPRVVQLRDRKR